VPRLQGPAYILRAWDFGESDLLVSFLEQDRGKRRGVAKGAKKSRKRFGGLLAPLVRVQLEYVERPGQPLVRLEGCSLIQVHGRLSADLGKLLVACCLREILERVLPDGEGGGDFFLLLHETLARLDREETPGCQLWIFLLRTLALLGLTPQLGQCIHCRRPLAPVGLFGFSIALGGPVCGVCIHRGTSTDRVHAETLRLMRQWLSVPCTDPIPSVVPGRVLSEASVLIERFYLHHVAKEFRSLRVLRDVENRTRQHRKEGFS